MEKYYISGEKLNQYTVVKTIGEGKYGIAYLVKDTDEVQYVIKQLKNDMLEASRKKLFYETEILKNLDDDRLPKFIEEFVHRGNIIYVLKFLEGKDFEVILNEEEKEFSKDEIYNIAWQLVQIIDTLQEKGIVHRDIRTPNVLMDENNKVKLIDFGLARYINNDKYIKEMDFWYFADFLIHLYYTSYYIGNESEEKPWFEELDISQEESTFLKRLMGIESSYIDIEEVKSALKNIILLKDNETYSN